MPPSCVFGPCLGGKQSLGCASRGNTSHLSCALLLPGPACVVWAAGQNLAQAHMPWIWLLPCPVPADAVGT